MHDEIVSALRQIEYEKQVHILLAVESGSRAWGFASLDSDYDVRAIYVPPPDWYWSIEPSPKDTFESMLPNDIDLSAWELRKMLRLFHDGNPSLMEWFGSPIVYCADTTFQADMLQLLPSCFNPIKARHHYLSLANKAMSSASEKHISIKTLFYALRGLLAAAWCVERQTMPPTEFHRLLTLESIPTPVLSEIQHLLTQKTHADEKTLILLSNSLEQFYSSEYNRIQSATPSPFHPPSSIPFDEVLRQTISRKYSITLSSLPNPIHPAPSSASPTC